MIPKNHDIYIRPNNDLQRLANAVNALFTHTEIHIQHGAREIPVESPFAWITTHSEYKTIVRLLSEIWRDAST